MYIQKRPWADRVSQKETQKKVEGQPGRFLFMYTSSALASKMAFQPRESPIRIYYQYKK